MRSIAQHVDMILPSISSELPHAYTVPLSPGTLQLFVCSVCITMFMYVCIYMCVCVCAGGGVSTGLWDAQGQIAHRKVKGEGGGPLASVKEDLLV